MWELLFALALAGTIQGQETTIWGGSHVEMEMTDKGARLEFDCAHGTIDEAIRPDERGAFKVSGTYTPERGGPQREDEGSRTVKATYAGTITGDTMRLTVTTADDKEGQTYVLARNKHGRVVKCR